MQREEKNEVESDSILRTKKPGTNTRVRVGVVDMSPALYQDYWGLFWLEDGWIFASISRLICALLDMSAKVSIFTSSI